MSATRGQLGHAGVASGCWLVAIGYQLPASSHQLSATRYQLLCSLTSKPTASILIRACQCILFLTGEPMTLADTLLEPVVRDDKDIREEPLYRILMHNDDVTPFDYVIRMLKRIFMLSQELAEHIAETAHDEGVAIVMIRPRPEAEKLIGIARTHARADGYPLTFSMEPD